ncbi:Uma2 family endonuclease [Alicyclobacillus macrosporangiidus]|uniref:Endonuclease, Uma2 family (Restriction endonuclease fold) n=1 Tax=Alicyclobacillus macrosporangiidus TaxID=392015 RepID=A0A1I7KH71_9BACL|nr:Uma2 family endonuclease [Alicyclobacillus macrosporangiidus]SFU96783.1 Endonuclease, Uma2 family (restriction endonuclease fold) [Alicyclobacillus macrosporangiidus]
MENRRWPKRIREQGWTYDDYAALPEEVGRFEVIDGALEAMSPAPSLPHQVISRELYRHMSRCDDEYLVLYSPLDVILSPRHVLQPDLVMIHRDRLEICSVRGVEGPPDVVVEILSPSSADKDRGRKMQVYAHFGVPEYWVVDPDAAVLERYTADEGGGFRLAAAYRENQTVMSNRFPCIRFCVRDVFQAVPKFRS